jgi:Fic family protein
MSSGATVGGDIRARILELKAEWDRAQPLPGDSEGRLWQKLRLEWNYHSNHIEGNTLTFGETMLLLLHGRTSGDHEFREYEEIKGHDAAIGHVRMMAASPQPLTESDVRNLNRIAFVAPFWKAAITADGQPTRKQIFPGQYKTQPNNVVTPTGEIYYFTSPEETPARMSELMRWFRESLASDNSELAEILAAFHHRFSVIHPFDDGNGRCMRLLVNYALLRKGFPPMIIRTENKKDYLRCLSEADAGNLGPFTTFIEQHLVDALESAMVTVQGSAN